MAPQPGKRAPGQTVSKLDRDTSKKNVAINKADQRAELARKVAAKKFAERQKELKKDLDEATKLKALLDGILKKIKEDQTLDSRFMGQVIKKVKALKDFPAQLKQDRDDFGDIVDAPATYTAAIAQAGQLSPPSAVKTYGDMAVMLAMLIVILNRVLRLKAKP